MVQSDMTNASPRPDFDPVLSMAVAGSWWDLGRRLAPFAGEAASPEQQTAALRDWAAAILKDEDDQDVIDAVTEDGLRTFVATVLPVLERKFDGREIAAEVQRLISAASYYVSDEGHRLNMKETSEAFWAWEYLYLFNDMHWTHKSDWITAVSRCAECNVFFIKTRIDQRFHSDACRKKAANLRFYRSDRAKAKRRGK